MQARIRDHAVDTQPIELHLHYHIQAVIGRILNNLYQQAEVNEELNRALATTHPFTGEYADSLLQYGDTFLDSVAILEQEAQALENQHRIHFPLRALGDSLDIQPSDIRVLLAAALIEVDLRFGSLFATLQQPLNSRAPCIGLLNWLLAGDDVLAAARTLEHHGYLTIDKQGDSRAEWLLRVPPIIWDALRGQSKVFEQSQLTLHHADEFPTLSDLILDAELGKTVEHLPDMLRQSDEQTLILRGIRGTGRRTLFGALARDLGYSVLLVDQANATSQQHFGALATLLGAFPLLQCNPAPGETIKIDRLSGYRGIIGVTIGRTGGLDGKLLEQSLSLRLNPPNIALRQQFWQRSTVPLNKDEEESILRRFLLTGGAIQRVAQRAYIQAQLSGRDSVSADDVQLALRTLNLQALETLATPLTTGGGWEHLIVSPALRDELRVLAMRCRERETLQANAGRAFKNNLNRGVRALFSGASGTGKTLAARVLASVLGMDIFRVDLAAVVNKYIGETERNLNEVFSRAEELDVLLLLDEGDSLLTRRTDVSSSNDRYANLETNYLLQRLEQYDGIVFITTNAIKRIDDAFMRRLDAVIEFSFPEAEERFALFKLHLPQEHRISTGFLQDVASRCRLTGGQIRNVALHAMLLAIESDSPIYDEHLKGALQTIYRREGMSYPFTERNTSNRQIDRLQSYSQQLDS